MLREFQYWLAARIFVLRCRLEEALDWIVEMAIRALERKP